MTKPLRIAFMGTPDFAATALQALCDTPHDIVCVYSQPPRPKGRGQKTQKSPVQTLAESRNIPVFTPLNFKDDATIAEFQSHAVDVAIIAAYGLILPQPILDAPQFGCVNIHASLLPRWRGASPIQHAIWYGDPETGISIMQMERGLDTGPVIVEESLPITPTTTASSLHDDLAAMGARMICECVDVLSDIRQPFQAMPQDNAAATYAPLLSKEDGRINWTQSALQIDRQIRALTPWPGVWTMRGDKRIKMLKAQPSSTVSKAPVGTILNKQGDIVCGNGSVLTLQMLQPEGKKPMDITSAINGGYITIQDRLA